MLRQPKSDADSALLRLGVIGSVNRDTITAADGTVSNQLGGALYTALALAHLGRGAIEVLLLSKIGADVAADVGQRLLASPLVLVEGLSVQDTANFHCQIRYSDDGSKTEVLSGDLDPWSRDELEPWLASLDGVLVNFVTGLEMDQPTLAFVRRRVNGPVLADLHSLALGREASGRRFWRRPDNWRNWLSAADVVQMNAREAVVLGALEGEEDETLTGFALAALERGPEGVVVTMGDRGGIAAWRDETGVGEVVRYSALDTHLAVDPTGCGDVFLAALGATLATGGDLPTGVRLAARAAALNSRLRGIDELEALATISF